MVAQSSNNNKEYILQNPWNTEFVVFRRILLKLLMMVNVAVLQPCSVYRPGPPIVFMHLLIYSSWFVHLFSVDTSCFISLFNDLLSDWSIYKNSFFQIAQSALSSDWLKIWCDIRQCYAWSTTMHQHPVPLLIYGIKPCSIVIMHFHNGLSKHIHKLFIDLHLSDIGIECTSAMFNNLCVYLL